MIRNKKLLGLIPARGGSKRLPGKNTMDLSGKPLIAWSIDAANRSKYIDKVIVSTDDQAIANIAIASNAEIPFMRPSHLATDEASSIDTVLHAIENIHAMSNENYEYIILLQPTSPLRTSKHIDIAVELLLDLDADGIVSICDISNNSESDNSCSYKIPIQNIINKDTDNFIENQYKVNGAIYLSKIDLLTRELAFFHDKSYGYIMSPDESIDIDCTVDFMKCDSFIRNLGN
jgi:CMP-N,N'-diacetyllegionaminic acid synthase